MHDGTEWDSSLGSVAAELTVAAYPVALQQGLAGSWVDLEIELWMALVKGLRKWGWPSQPLHGPAADLWQNNLVAELTDAAYRVTLKYGVRGSFLDLELGLHHAFHAAMDGIRAARAGSAPVAESYPDPYVHLVS